MTGSASRLIGKDGDETYIDLLASVLQSVRLTGSMQFCFMPTGDLPQKPWARTPVLHYGEGPDLVRLPCGYPHCEVLDFAPLQHVLQKLIHIRTTGKAELNWLSTMLQQIIREVDEPRPGSALMIERLTEVTLIEVLRYKM